MDIHTPFTSSLVHRVARQAMAYPYRRWGFGEDIAVRGLYETAHFFDDARYSHFVHTLLGHWCRNHAPLTPPDHVTPGVPILLLYEDSGDCGFLAAARELAELYGSFPLKRQVRLHRAELSPWQDTIWVDCMYMDAPFLVRLGRVTREERWLELGIEHICGYARVLHDGESGLFWHGFDAALNRTRGCLWGRGNGWALLGLVETLEELPQDHPAYSYLHNLLLTQTQALTKLQSSTGLWHTILPDAESPLEPSTAALFAAGLLRALRLGMLEDSKVLQSCVQRALDVVARELTPTGELHVSAATPIGDRDTYVEQRLGVYPWGQGPALLAMIETLRLEVPEEPDEP